MSNEDIERTFAFLDSKNKGKINYNEFCKLV
jgi:Ca2+-binding EF-hand superfamily protein